MPDDFRLSRFLARAGVASRRKAEDYILSGRVSVNGQVCREFNQRIDPAHDTVTVEGKPVGIDAPLTLAMYKPTRMLVSRGDPGNRPTVYDILPVKYGSRATSLTYVGRLDWDTEGLLLLTTDGELVHRSTHPSFHVEKEYWIASTPPLGNAQIRNLREGVTLDDGPAHAREIAALPDAPEGFQTRMVLAEGRNRIVRRMVEEVGSQVVALRRVRFGPIALGDLALGEVREVVGEELARMRAACGLESPK